MSNGEGGAPQPRSGESPEDYGRRVEEYERNQREYSRAAEDARRKVKEGGRARRVARGGYDRLRGTDPIGGLRNLGILAVLLIVSWFVAMSFGNIILIVPIMGISIAVMYLSGWPKLIVGGGSFIAIIFITVWPLLSTFIAGGIPTLQFSLFEWFGFSGETFDMLSNPEYYIFSMMNPTHFERTTTSDAPNIAVKIDNFEASPATNCFGSQFIVSYIVENEGDNPIKVGTGFRVPVLTPIGTYPCPCEILKTGESDSYAGVGSSECSQYGPTQSRFWSGDWEDELKCVDYLTFASCEGVYWLKQIEGEESYRWDEVISGSDNAPYNLQNPTPLAASSCGYFGSQLLQPGVPYQKVCQNVVYHPASGELTTESCQIEAFATFTDWSTAILQIQFVDTDYYVMRDLTPYTQPSITSTGGAALSLSAGQQPLLDTYDIMSLTAGIANAGTGDLTNTHLMYLFIPDEIVKVIDGKVCNNDIWDCGVSSQERIDRCTPAVKHCGICGCPTHSSSPDWIYTCSSSDVSECLEMEIQDGICEGSACSCPEEFSVYEDRCGSGTPHCSCYKPTGEQTSAEDCNIMDTLMDAGQADDFVEECNSLATDYHVCVLKPEQINQYTLYSCPINIGDDMNLGGDELRRSYIARLDAFYDYEITSALTVSGVSCG